MADAVASVCVAEPETLTKTGSESGGPTEWTYAKDGTSFTAYSSGEYHAGVSVESCGQPTNGISIPEMHASIWKQAEQGWRIEVVHIMCGSAEDLPIDTLGPSAPPFACTVWDEGGFQSYAFVSVTRQPPYFEVALAD